MERLLRLALILSFAISTNAEAQNPISTVMCDKYYEMWNDSVQTKIDSDIEKYRKADAVICLPGGVMKATDVKVEQISSDFLFGSNIFLYGQFDTPEKNRAYESVFGQLFNAATIAFYWKTLEPEKGKPRYTADSPYISRRPAPDPVVDFCESKGIIMKGHAIIYGLRTWGHPDWMPADRKQMEAYFETHVRELAERYKGRIKSWDVVNEPIDQADRGLMPDDYTYKTFQNAMKYFPDSVELNINDCDMHGGPRPRYVELVRNLIDRGVRIDNVGVEMHIFGPSEAARIAKEGIRNLSPEKIWAVLDCFSQCERPMFVSEVTIPAPEDTEWGREVQSVLTRDLYRLWFSYPTVRGITWWNLADGGAAQGEPTVSGLIDKNGQKKPAYYVLDNLINNEWHTSLTLKSDAEGKVSFRGFKGNYRVSWKDRKGIDRTLEYYVK